MWDIINKNKKILHYVECEFCKEMVTSKEEKYLLEDLEWRNFRFVDEMISCSDCADEFSRIYDNKLEDYEIEGLISVEDFINNSDEYFHDYFDFDFQWVKDGYSSNAKFDVDNPLDATHVELIGK